MANRKVLFRSGARFDEVSPSADAVLIASIDQGATTFTHKASGTTLYSITTGGLLTMNGDFSIVPATDDKGTIGVDPSETGGDPLGVGSQKRFHLVRARRIKAGATITLEDSIDISNSADGVGAVSTARIKYESATQALRVSENATAFDDVVLRTKAQTLTNKTFTAPAIADFTSSQHNHQNAAGGGQLDHGLALTGASLGDDDHTQYALLAGRAGGQTLIGGSAASENLVFQSTSNATRGTITANDQFRTTSTSTLAAIRIGSFAGDPSTLANGDIWYNSTTGKFRGREAGTSKDIISTGSGTVTGSGTANRMTKWNTTSDLTDGPVDSNAGNTVLNPTADNAVALGTASLRFTALALSSQLNIFAALGDANPTQRLSDASESFGAGGGSALDVRMRRTAAAVMTFDDTAGALATLSGDTGGLSVRGGTAASNSLTLSSTSNATKGSIFIGGDTTSFYDETTHDLIIANFTGATPSTGVRFETMTDGAGGWVCTVYDAGNNPFFNGQRANGTHSAPTGVTVGNTLMTFGGTGHNGTSLLTTSRASVRMFAAETWTLTANGTRIGLFTTLNTTTTQSERLRVGNDGQIAVMGSTAAFDASFLMHIRGTADPVSYTVDAYGTGIRPLFMGRFARGTVAAPTAAQADDILVGMSGRGYGATVFSTDERGAVHVHAAQNWSDTVQGTYVAVHTTPNGSVTQAETWRFDQNGDLIMETNANLIPNADNQGNVGTAAKRFSAIATLTTNYFAAAADANPAVQMSTTGLRSGVGGAGALDTRFARTAASTWTIDNNAGGGTLVLSAVTGALYYESSTGAAAAVSGAATGRLIYNNTTATWQVSVQAGAYSSLITTASLSTTAFLQGGNSFGAAANLGTNDAFDLNFRRAGATVWTVTATALNPASDASRTIGTASLRISTIVANQFDIYGAAGDANPVQRSAGGANLFGAGGATALDTQIQRTAAATLVLDNAANGAATLSGGSAGNMTVRGSSQAGGSLLFSTTSNATKGNYDFGTIARFDEVNTRFLFGTQAPIGTERWRVTGGTAIVDFTSTTAFQVTQTGGGSPVFIVDTTNRFLGFAATGATFTPAFDFHAQKEEGAGLNFVMDYYSNTGGLNFEIQARRARGTIAVPVALADDDDMWEFGGYGYDGAAFSGQQVAFLMESAGAWTGANHGTRMTFKTTPQGSITIREVLVAADDACIIITGGTNALAAATAGEKLRVEGSARITQAAATTGTPPIALFVAGGTHLTLTAAEAIDVDFSLTHTVQFTSGATFATQRAVVFRAPTYIATAASQTITDAATVAITGAPIQSTNVIFTRTWAWWVQSGATRFDGDIVQVAANNDFRAAVGDANPTQRQGGASILFGAGGASALDTRFARTSASAITIDNNAGGGTFVFSAVTGSLFHESSTGAAAAVSGAATGRLIYNNTAGFWQVSMQAGAYQNVATVAVGGGTLAFVQSGNSFGVAASLGSNDAFDLNLRTNGTVRWVFTQGTNNLISQAAGTLRSTADNQLTIGTATQRCVDVVSILFRVFAASADANPTVSVSTGSITMGAGGATAVDLRISRSAVNTLRIDNNAAGAATVLGGADNTLTIGTAASRLVDVVAITHRVFAAASDANASASLLSGGIALGVGGATALDTRMRRTAAATLTLDNNGAGAVTVVPATDNQNILGTAALRWSTINAVTANFVLAVSDANPAVRVDNAGVYFGAGGASALDCRIRRTAATTLTLDNNSTGGIDIVPATTNVGHIGTDALKWNRVRATSVVTGDLEMKDEAKGVHYVLQEEKDGIYVRDMVKRKMYKIPMVEVPWRE